MFTVLDKVGSLVRESDSTHVVNVWQLPPGYGHAKNMATNIFFPDQVSAYLFAEKWRDIPELAGVMTIEQYDAIVTLFEESRLANKT